MNNEFLIIFDYAAGALRIIELNGQDIEEYKSGKYPDFESYLKTIEPRYGFHLNDSKWIVTDILDTEVFIDGRNESFSAMESAAAHCTNDKPSCLTVYDYSIPTLFFVRLTEEEMEESTHYEDYEEYLDTLTDTYGFTITCSDWMITSNITVHSYRDKKEIPPYKFIEERYMI